MLVSTRPFQTALSTILLILAVALETNAVAIDRSQPLAQLQHSSWTARDGLSGAISVIAQGSDGFLWIGTTTGLFRFDGITFEAYRPIQGTFPATLVSALCPTKDGLWIGYSGGGVSYLKNGILTNYTDADGLPVSVIRSIVKDADDTIWVAAVGGMARFENKRWHKIRNEWNFKAHSAGALYVDQQGTLWAPSEGRMYFLPKGSHSFEDAGIDIGMGVNHLSGAPDGSLWYVERAENKIAVVRKDDHGVWLNQKTSLSGIDQVWIDSDGSVWVGTNTGDGITRIPTFANVAVASENFTSRDGLTGKSVDIVLEDKEGNIWIGTEGGLDRFRSRNLWWFRAAGGKELSSLAFRPDGDVWAIPQFGHIFSVKTGKDIPGSPENLNRIYSAPSGELWLNTREGITTWTSGKFENLVAPEAVSRILAVTARDPIHLTSLTVDGEGRLWVGIGGRGEFCIRNGEWSHVPFRINHPDWSPNVALASRSGEIWLANDSYLAAYKDGKSSIYDGEQGPQVGPIRAMREVMDVIVIGGERGLSSFRNGRFFAIRPWDSDDFGTVGGILATPESDIWLATSKGIIHIGKEEVERTFHQENYRVQYDLLDLVSDLPDSLSSPFRNETAIRTNDGQLWFSTLLGFARIIPPLRHSSTPPPVAIKTLIADNQFYSPFEHATLPALTHQVHFDYTALSLSLPQRTQFRYKLEGFDPGWSEIGTARSTTYTNLRPGEYVFRVIASNADGIWNNVGAYVTFRIVPAWYQTTWFLLACIVLAGTGAWYAHRYRLRQITQTLNARFDVRLEERTRIARDLHDTLIQTIQGSKYVADASLEDALEDSPLRRSMERIANWLGEAIREGRAALTALHLSAKGSSGLEDLFQGAIAECQIYKPISTDLKVTGTVLELHPIVRDDVYLIGYEALRNAFLHSSAQNISVSITYTDHDLTLTIQDDGRGIPSEVLERGKPGHFGLGGMRERAERIGASFDIHTQHGTGTVVTLVVQVRSRPKM